MSKREVNLLIEDIIESANKILIYTAGLTFDEFVNDDKTIDAVIRNFEIIGKRQTGCQMILKKFIM